MPHLQTTLVRAPDQVVVRLTGDVDLSTAPLVADALAQAAELRTRQVVVDLAGARFWDCSGLHVLAEFTGELERGKLAATQAKVESVLGARRASAAATDELKSLTWAACWPGEAGDCPSPLPPTPDSW